MSEFERETREFNEHTIGVLGTLVRAVDRILKTQESMASELASVRGDVDEVKKLAKDTHDYAQARAGDMKKTLAHLGIEGD